MALTEGIRNALKTAAAALKGHARRVFVAQVVRDLGRGGQRQAQAQWGWSRDTIRKGDHELSTGIECVDARSATGAKPIDARLPNLRQDIRDLVDGQSQADPRFESQRVYCKLSAAKVVELLIDKKGYRSVALPSNEAIACCRSPCSRARPSAQCPRAQQSAGQLQQHRDDANQHGFTLLSDPCVEAIAGDEHVETCRTLPC